MRITKGKIVWMIVLVVAVLMGVLVVSMLPKAVPVEQAYPDLALVENGKYEGSLDNGLVAATVRVTVLEHKITGIEIVEHRNGQGAPAEAIVQDVLQAQNLDVDTVAGATMSSKTILKAIENALFSANQ